MSLLLAIFSAKLIYFFSRFFKIGGGSAAPGLFALKIEPDLVEKLARGIPKNIIITGTNGKTTTARLIAHFAKQSSLRVIRNHTGSNLERGIASTLTSNFDLRTSLFHSDLGIWELDEAAFNVVAPKIKPGMIVFLNVFRDQLDRYGEIDSVVKNWCQTLKDLDKNTLVLVNGDDSNTKSLRNCFKGRVEMFGVKDYKIVGESIEYLKEKESLDFEAINVRPKGLEGSSFYLQSSTFNLPVILPIPGIYHIYDAIAALACAYHLNLPVKELANWLINFSPAFGRVEKFQFTPRGWRHKLQCFIFLIKNPAGATQVFETIAPDFRKDDRLLVALNDNLADGTDVSWIWDAEFEKLKVKSARFANKARRVKGKVVCSGIRAQDLAVRFKYAGFDPNNITVENGLKKAFKEALAGLKGRLFILPTYTAMLELQSILARMGIKRHYWEAE